MADEPILGLEKFLAAYYNWMHFKKLSHEQREGLEKLKKTGRAGSMYYWNVREDMPDLHDINLPELYSSAKNLVYHIREQKLLHRIHDDALRNILDNADKKWQKIFPNISLPAAFLENRHELASILRDHMQEFLYDVSLSYEANFIQSILINEIPPIETIEKLQLILNKITENPSLPRSSVAFKINTALKKYIADRREFTPEEVAAFKPKYHEFLSELAMVPKQNALFATLDHGAFSKHIDDSKSREIDQLIAALDSDDKLNGWQRARLAVENLGRRAAKMTDRHLSRIYENAAAFEIMEQILITDKFNPAEGLEKFSALLKNVKSIAGKNVVGLFEKVLGSLPKEVLRGALKNSTQMNVLVQEVIKHASNRDNIYWEAQYKTILECLFVLRNGIFDADRTGIKSFKPDLLQGLPMFQPGPLKWFAKAGDFGVKMIARGLFEATNSAKKLAFNRKGGIKLKTSPADNDRLETLAKANDFEGEDADMIANDQKLVAALGATTQEDIAKWEELKAEATELDNQILALQGQQTTLLNNINVVGQKLQQRTNDKAEIASNKADIITLENQIPALNANLNRTGDSGVREKLGKELAGLMREIKELTEKNSMLVRQLAEDEQAEPSEALNDELNEQHLYKQQVDDNLNIKNAKMAKVNAALADHYLATGLDDDGYQQKIYAIQSHQATKESLEETKNPKKEKTHKMNTLIGYWNGLVENSPIEVDGKKISRTNKNPFEDRSDLDPDIQGSSPKGQHNYVEATYRVKVRKESVAGTPKWLEHDAKLQEFLLNLHARQAA
ncbi:MAG: hypothetical protein LBB23_04480 [Rickettsiales bacterium]|jgi:hypothetical protein|nr:hypothetical protein [Rickettsiales bacterium]